MDEDLIKEDEFTFLISDNKEISEILIPETISLDKYTFSILY